MQIEHGVSVVIVIGVCEAVKRTGKVPHELLPLLNLILGITFVFLTKGFLLDSNVVVEGVVAGLVASGLYDTAKGSYRVMR